MGARLALVLLALAGCSSARELPFAVRFADRNTQARAEIVEVAIFEGESCEPPLGEPVYHAEVERDGSPASTPPELERGSYVFTAAASSGPCGVLARACVIVSLPSDRTLELVLATADGLPDACTGPPPFDAGPDAARDGGDADARDDSDAARDADAMRDARVDAIEDARLDADADTDAMSDSDAISDASNDADADASCGARSEVCCDDSPRCVSGAVCNGGTCAACGGAGQLCCTSGVCNFGRLCGSGTCSIPCGGSFQPCCAGNICATGYICAATSPRICASRFR